LASSVPETNLSSSSLVMWPMIAMCAPVARTGAFLAIVCSGFPSHALRRNGTQAQIA
jgi:hypothetical protein